MANVEIFNPDSVSRPGGAYSHLAKAPPGAAIVAIAGQIAVDADGTLVGAGDFDAQCRQVYDNVGAAVRAAGGDWSNVIQMMTFLTRREDVPRLRAWRQLEFPRLFGGGAYPPNTLLVVNGLASEELLLEVQALAAI